MTRLTGVVPPASWTVVMAVSLTAVAATAVLGTGLAVHGVAWRLRDGACSFTVGQVTGITPPGTPGGHPGRRDPALLQKGQRDGSR